MSDPIARMRNRADQCRRLADETHDERMRWQLIDWANEIEADAANLESERATQSQRAANDAERGH